MTEFTNKEIGLIRFMAKDMARFAERDKLPQETINTFYTIADKCSTIRNEKEKEEKPFTEVDFCNLLKERTKNDHDEGLLYNIRYTKEHEPYLLEIGWGYEEKIWLDLNENDNIEGIKTFLESLGMKEDINDWL